jgi:outer membrane lipoprotein-sorting protein
MKKIIVMLSAILTLCGCGGRVEGYSSAQDKLMNMQSYRANAEITYISGGEETVYKAVQTADNSGKYKMVTYFPEEFKDNAILFDGKMIWQYNPSVEKKISVNSADKPERSELIVFAFMENYVKSKDKSVAAASLDDTKYTVMEADIEGAGKYIVSEKLWVSNETMLPERLVIYDAEGKERIVTNFSEFEYNPELAEDEFAPQK